ncbi:putative leucine-rich repeat receptor-like protein kinase [Apostasia shenzhenica]|uniref:non-specific serine/threonine protein kinase n=1 Tax=Apostasia shenzhenica TaxID=1088818 RepID=A0A2I0BGN5_9ASPA|nr:putative leucine-rich repeat receptor-like protein kinase [Apostasia shenzhenica]
MAARVLMAAKSLPLQVLLLLLLLLFAIGLHVCYGDTDPQDAAALLSLMNQWENTLPSWGGSDDPCGMAWDGVICNNSRVTVLKLSTMGIKGYLASDIGQLTELRSLDLSYNNELGGPLTPNIGNLKKLTTLILLGCSFSGTIPSELGNLQQLSFLALNSNKFSGEIPASLGGLSNLYWLDVADNQLSGTLPISTDKTPGLDKLLHTKHFHFNKNKLSGNIPEELFSSNMSLIHLLFDGNQFTGEIPASVGLVETLEVMRLDRNILNGAVPSDINNLVQITELNLANNKLTGPLPNLSGMLLLNYLDLSNNSFDPSEAPAWFSKLSSLTALVIESGRIYGEVPEELFSFPQLEQVILDNNQFNGTLTMGNTISQQLQIVNFENNAISSYTVSSKYNHSLILIGNPVCNTQLSNTGMMIFRAPRFRDITNVTLFQSLESSLWIKLGLTPGSVFLQRPMFDSDSYIELQVKLFPSEGIYFNRSEVLRIGFDLSNQTYKPPPIFGPYYFIATPYPFPDQGGKSSMSKGLIIAIVLGSVFLFAGVAGAGIYAFLQKKRARRAMELSRPFASWAISTKDSEGPPQLKGARWFSFAELQKSTNNFSEDNEIGYGGYGKVYKGILSSGQTIAIKRAQQGSMQGGHEFKTEIELLSRVHHKNLVGLVGFCFEQGEQMLVYEFIPNGTLRNCLTGKNRMQLDWKRRLRIALGSARGLAYLHELADPPIIHRDVKSSNILLDEHLTAKVADFGLSRLASGGEKGHVSTQVKGTLGYLDPEYYMSQQLTEKSDVYSFGVVMLELISAKPPIEKGRYIVREVKVAVNRNDDELLGLKQIIDPAILNTVNPSSFRRFSDIALRCVEETASDRPPMSEVVKEIEMILQNDGLSTNSTSASSSATDFGSSKSANRHLYSDSSFPAKEGKEGAFDYSGGLTLPAKPEPK